MPFSNKFMHEIAGEVLCKMNQTNTAVCPFSLMLGLTVVSMASTKQTQTHDQMCRLLGMNPENEEIFIEDCNKTKKEIIEYEGDVKINMASSIWCDGSVKNEFKEWCSQKMGVQVRALVEGKFMNAWVAEHTKDHIKQIVTGDPEGPLVILQAFDFDGKWTFPFNPAKTYTAPFHFDCRKPPMTCQMMQMTQRLQHGTISGVEILRLPYGDDSNFVAHVLMPPMGYEKDEFDNIKKATDLVFDPTAWNLAMDSLVYEKFKLRMPKFKIECNESLDTPLYMLGMKDAFGKDKIMPSFERLTDTSNVYVKSVKQAIKMEVNEVGTKMVSSDAIEIGFRGRGPYDTIEVNRRFLFVVSHLPTGAIMLASIVYTPEYK